MRLKLNKRKKYETKIKQEKEEKMMMMMNIRITNQNQTYKNNFGSARNGMRLHKKWNMSIMAAPTQNLFPVREHT